MEIAPARRAVRVFGSRRHLYREAAAVLLKTAREALRRRGRFAVALSGGVTPEPLYRLMGGAAFRRKFPWRKTHFFWADERWVPRSDPRNNAGRFLAAVGGANTPARNIHAVDTALETAGAAASYYAADLESFFGRRRVPCFDLILLGAGEDGHVASLFPRSSALNEKRRWVVSARAPITPRERITLTVPVILSARRVVFLVCGAEKTGAMKRTFARGRSGRLPARIVFLKRRLETFWFLDRAAASAVPGIA